MAATCIAEDSEAYAVIKTLPAFSTILEIMSHARTCRAFLYQLLGLFVSLSPMMQEEKVVAQRRCLEDLVQESRIQLSAARLQRDRLHDERVLGGTISMRQSLKDKICDLAETHNIHLVFRELFYEWFDEGKYLSEGRAADLRLLAAYYEEEDKEKHHLPDCPSYRVDTYYRYQRLYLVRAPSGSSRALLC